MSDDTAAKAGRFIVVALRMVATLSFGLASLCGAAFTVMAMPDVLASRAGSYVGAVFIFSVPSLLIGGALAWWCGRVLSRKLRGSPKRP